jgi:hypothetical protein
MHLKLFVHHDCPTCPEAQQIMTDIDGVEVLDISEMDGLAQASHHAVMDAPSLIVLDSGGNEVRGWRGELPDAAQVRALIAQ